MNTNYILLILGSISLIGTIGTIVYVKNQDQNKNNEESRVIVQNKIDDKFWKFKNLENKKELKNQNQDGLLDQFNNSTTKKRPQLPKEFLKKVEQNKTKKQTLKPKKKTKSIPKIKKTPIIPTQIVDEIELENNLIEDFNLKRRASFASYTKTTFLNKTKQNYSKEDDYSEYGLEQDQASYPVDLSRVITADRFISAVLINQINSELGGKVISQIENNIYGAHGRFVLIPSGSKAIGEFKPLKKVGEKRLEIRWKRIITPNGINITFLEDAQMTDQMGRSGISGEVDNKYFEKYGIALLVTLINTAVTSYVMQESDEFNRDLLVSSSGEVGKIANEILKDNINIKPTVKIPKGSRIKISPVTDIWFKKPVKNKIQVVTSYSKGEEE